MSIAELNSLWELSHNNLVKNSLIRNSFKCSFLQSEADFTSNDYLGLRKDSRVVEAGCDAARCFGAGAGASRSVLEINSQMAKAEDMFAALTGFKYATLFNSGFVANLACLDSLSPFYFENNISQEIFIDHRSHASLFSALKHSGFNYCVFKHAKYDHLVKKLQNSFAVIKIIVVESLYSMDGDYADFDVLKDICENFNALLIIDESHSFGVCGKKGGGYHSYFPDLSQHILAMTVGCGKSIGVSGGFLATNSEQFLNRIKQKCKHLIYSTAPPPFTTGAICRSLEIIQSNEGEMLRQKLKKNIKYLLQKSDRFQNVSCSQIVSYITGENEKALSLSVKLIENGLIVRPMRPPTVPRGTARLRITLHSYNTEDQIDKLSNFLK